MAGSFAFSDSAGMKLPVLALLAAFLAAPAPAEVGARAGSSWQPDLARPADFLRALPRAAVLRVTDFGARPNDAVEDGPAIVAALAEAQARGARAVLLPAGDYVTGRTVLLPSNVALMGEGCGKTRIRRAPAHRGQILFRVDGVSNVRVPGIAFEHDGAPAFTRSIGLYGRGSSNIAILDNCFDDARPTGGRGDRWAIELSAEDSPSRNVWIGRNRSRGVMQLTAGGGIGVDVLRIVDNDVADARNAGIAVTHNRKGATFRDLLIAGNRIERAHGLGIYIGPDAPGATGGLFQDVTIRDNVITGFTGATPYGIYVRAAELKTERFTVLGNQLDGRGQAETTAIRFVDKHGGGKRRAADILIEANIVSGFQRGVLLDHVAGASVRRNRIAAIRPLGIPGETNRDIRVEP